MLDRTEERRLHLAMLEKENILLAQKDILMPLYIKDDAVADLVGELAKRKGLSKRETVRIAVQKELDGLDDAIPLEERFAALRARYPLPEPTGEVADKAFFDDLSGNL